MKIPVNPFKLRVKNFGVQNLNCRDDAEKSPSAASGIGLRLISNDSDFNLLTSLNVYDRHGTSEARLDKCYIVLLPLIQRLPNMVRLPNSTFNRKASTARTLTLLLGIESD